MTDRSYKDQTYTFFVLFYRHICCYIANRIENNKEPKYETNTYTHSIHVFKSDIDRPNGSPNN